MTSTDVPATQSALRGALRKHAGVWIQRFYRHELLVARTVKGFQVDAVEAFRREVVDPIIRRVAGGLATFDARGTDIVLERFPQMRQLVSDVETIVERGIGRVQSLTQGNLRSLVQSEAEWVSDSASKVLRVQPPRLDVARINAEVADRPYLGGKVEEWFGSLIGGDDGAADNVRSMIRTGLQQGWSEQEIVRSLRGRRDTGYTDGLLTGQNVDQIRGLVRAAASHASATTRMESFKALGVTKWRWLATLDTKTCLVCGENERGSPYEVGEGPTFPAHPHCRCSPVPWFGDPEGTRASTDGPVPADQTFEDWLDGRSADEQDEVLGKTKGAAWRRGSLSLRELLGPDLQPLTLAELRRLDRIPGDG